METTYFLGIDVSKKKLDAALTIDGKSVCPFNFENSVKSIAGFFKSLGEKVPLGGLIVCMEHTGIYCQLLLNYLSDHEIRTCLERAVQIKKSQGLVRGKNDEIDAERIAFYAYKNREELKFWHPRRPVILKIKALLAVRERLVKAKGELSVPIEEGVDFVDPNIQKQISSACRQSIRAMEKDINATEDMIDKLIDDDEQLKTQFTRASSVVGIGKITALNIIVATGEFHEIREAKKFACYAGVAPFEYSSGTSVRGKTRVSKLANMTIKKLLHLSAMAAINYDPELRAYYHRKVSAGKNKMSALNGVRNKLIARVYACIRDQREFQKSYVHQLA